MTIEDTLLRASEERLWDLIKRRMADDADAASIDRQIWHLFGERWAIVFTDLAGFSRRTETFGITHFLQVIHRHRELLYPIIRDHGGILVKAEADSLLLIFRTAAAAIDCSISMQQSCARANERLIEEEKVHLCLGIGVGDILRIGDHDVWGREVNAASKLGEDTAGRGDILITGSVVSDLGENNPYEIVPIDTVVAGSDENFRVVY